MTLVGFGDKFWNLCWVCDNFVIFVSLECHCDSVYFMIVREDSWGPLRVKNLEESAGIPQNGACRWWE